MNEFCPLGTYQETAEGLDSVDHFDSKLPVGEVLGCKTTVRRTFSAI
jgi:hypothetical protein